MSRLPEILDSLGSGVMAVDLEDRIVYLNKTLAARFGVNREDWIGRTAGELGRRVNGRLSGTQAFGAPSEWAGDGGAGGSLELEWREEDKVVWFREDSYPLQDDRGRAIGRVYAYHDISREKAVDRMKTEFIAVASHELRTPMTSIKGSVDLILSGFAGDITADTLELLEIAQKNCDRLIRLINDILDLAKIEAGQIRLKPVRMDLTEAVERAMRGVKSLADQTGVTLRIIRPPALPLVEVDKDRIEQVATNLLSNAIKFSPPQSEVRIEMAVEESWVQCMVADQGCGIREEDLDKVFGKFQQVGEARKGGTGLGLAIAQALVHEHKGRIWVESKTNEGSRFIFRLPAVSATTAAAS